MAIVVSTGTTFKINSTKIDLMYSTPAMGVEPNKIDVDNFDSPNIKAKAIGKQDVNSFNFDFRFATTNFTAAHNLDTSTENNYEVAFPDGTKYTWKGTHRTFVLETSNDAPINFRVSCAVEGEFEVTPGTTS